MVSWNDDFAELKICQKHFVKNYSFLNGQVRLRIKDKLFLSVCLIEQVTEKWAFCEFADTNKIVSFRKKDVLLCFVAT